MPKINLPIDESGGTVPAMSLLDGGAHSISSSTTASKNTTPFMVTSPDGPDYGVISVYATKAVYLKFGDADVEATNEDHYFPEGLYYDFAIKPGHTHISVLRVTEDGTVYVSEKY